MRMRSIHSSLSFPVNLLCVYAFVLRSVGSQS